jgi:hypothetical protein
MRIMANDESENEDFAAQATEKRSSLAAEFTDFLKENKKWWLAPIVIAILGLGLLVLLGGTAAAPFIYTLF